MPNTGYLDIGRWTKSTYVFINSGLMQSGTLLTCHYDGEGGGELSPPVGAGVNSNSWHFRYGAGQGYIPPQPLKPGEIPPEAFIIPGSPAIISIRHDPGPVDDKGFACPHCLFPPSTPQIYMVQRHLSSRSPSVNCAIIIVLPITIGVMYVGAAILPGPSHLPDSCPSASFCRHTSVLSEHQVAVCML
ncbi:hypothetical protein GOODEAATRI_017535 [Goodea atripinnis]|uniref:Cadherin C-terminal catenin-binding domain-containing protein n=1 Tax=Goodea atripinnis TaxID=208336 RepID=A0ABV0P5P7_9TELE